MRPLICRVDPTEIRMSDPSSEVLHLPGRNGDVRVSNSAGRYAPMIEYSARYGTP